MEEKMKSSKEIVESLIVEKARRVAQARSGNWQDYVLKLDLQLSVQKVVVEATSKWRRSLTTLNAKAGRASATRRVASAFVSFVRKNSRRRIGRER
jgi:hypothetical protein